jgi:GNAT superfamily N-acetyltransferase
MTTLSTEKITRLGEADLLSLCESTEDAIRDGIGFNWNSCPAREVLESYWKGVLLVPERDLYGARLDGTLVGSIQLVRPSASKQMEAFRATITNHFIAPWARGHGLAVKLLEAAEEEAKRQGFSVILLSVRETQTRAIDIYKDHGYHCWGVLPCHESVHGKMLSGHFYYKQL